MKNQIYTEVFEFLQAYKTKNTYILKERFDIHGKFLEEIYQMLDFVEDKSKLHLFPMEEMDKKIGEQSYFSFYNFNEELEDSPSYNIDCVLFMDNEWIAIIRGIYNHGAYFPKFDFLYFDLSI